MGINLASYVGATQVRRMVLGDDNRAPDAAELERMKALVRDAMQRRRHRTLHLAAIRARHVCQDRRADRAGRRKPPRLGGIYASHIRDEGDAIMPALDEAFRIGREANIPVEIWHLKAAGKTNWGRMPEIVAQASTRRARRGWTWRPTRTPIPPRSTPSPRSIPPWAHDGGDKKMIERLKDPAMRARIRKEM